MFFINEVEGSMPQAGDVYRMQSIYTVHLSITVYCIAIFELEIGLTHCHSCSKVIMNGLRAEVFSRNFQCYQLRHQNSLAAVRPSITSSRHYEGYGSVRPIPTVSGVSGMHIIFVDRLKLFLSWHPANIGFKQCVYHVLFDVRGAY